MNKASKPTLLDQARDLSAGINRIAAAAKDDQLLEQFEEVEDSLRLQTENLRGLVVNLALLQAHQILPGKDLVPRVKLAALRRKIAILQKRLREERSQLTAQNTWASCEKDAVELAEVLRAKLQAAWTAHLIEQCHNVEAFAHFRQLSGCGEILDEIQDLATTIRAFESELPTAESDFAKIAKLETKISMLISKLDFGEVPDAVQQFLKRASQGGASLTELSDEVFSWLKKKKLAGGLKVITGIRSR